MRRMLVPALARLGARRGRTLIAAAGIIAAGVMAGTATTIAYGLALDIVDRSGGAAGLVDSEQIEWLRGELNAAGSRWVMVVSHQPLTTSEGGDAALSLLDTYPGVIATLSGHAHSTSIEPRETPAGGYWQLTAPALADYPQQARALKVVETEDGVAIETWMLDTAPGELSDISRELAYLDAGGGRSDDDEGTASDRNARLFLAR